MQAKAFWCAGSLALGVLAFGSVALGGCGDDDASPDAGDDSKPDGGGGSGGLGMIPRPDGGLAADDPVPECDRFDQSTCANGQQCRIVAREQTDTGQFALYPGCVADVAARGLGEPCDPFGGGFDPYEAPDLLDTVYVDPCAPGLYCGPDFAVRDHFSCQISCDLNHGIGCVAPQFCVMTSDNPYEQICVDGDSCDPSDSSSCGAGMACFLRPNDAQDAVLTLCLTVADMPLADGEECDRYGACEVGSACWGPVLKPRAEWVQTDLTCRRTCLVGAGDDSDAGVGDEDGGVSPSGCKSGTSCVGFAKSDFALTFVSGELGLCE